MKVPLNALWGRSEFTAIFTKFIYAAINCSVSQKKPDKIAGNFEVYLVGTHDMRYPRAKDYSYICSCNVCFMTVRCVNYKEPVDRDAPRKAIIIAEKRCLLLTGRDSLL